MCQDAAGFPREQEYLPRGGLKDEAPDEGEKGSLLAEFLLGF